MARPGVTYKDVASAAEQLIAAAKVPTIENIRIMLGTGSHSTIATHLRVWKNQADSSQAIATKEQLPADLVMLLKGLWESVMDQAADKIQLVQEESAQYSAELKMEIQRLTQDNAYWQEEFQKLKQEKELLCREKAVQEQANRHLEGEKIALLVAQENQHQQLLDKQTRIDELHFLHQQVQSNLEYFRETSNKQRMTDRKQYKETKTQLLQTIQHQKLKHAEAIDEINILRRELSRSQEALDRLNEKNDSFHCRAQELQTAFDKVHEDLIICAHDRDHWQNKYTQSQILAEERQAAAMNACTDVAVLTQQLIDYKAQVQALKKYIELLRLKARRTLRKCASK